MKRNRHKRTSEDFTSVHVVQLKIRSKPIRSPAYKRLPQAVKDRLEELREGIDAAPEQTITELLELWKEYPDVELIGNYLARAYSDAGDDENAEAVIAENLRRYPDYPMARIAQALVYLRKGESGKIPALFGHKWNLGALYPERGNEFSVVEAVSFWAVVGMYFLRTGQLEKAEPYGKLARELAPDHPMSVRLNHGISVQKGLRLLLQLQGLSR